MDRRTTTTTKNIDIPNYVTIKSVKYGHIIKHNKAEQRKKRKICLIKRRLITLMLILFQKIIGLIIFGINLKLCFSNYKFLYDASTGMKDCTGFLFLMLIGIVIFFSDDIWFTFYDDLKKNWKIEDKIYYKNRIK